MRAIDADELKKCVLKWLPQDPCGKEEKEMPFETDICVSMLMDIDEQPTIQPEPHWIPVEQALPEKEGKYLCTRTCTWCVDGKATKVTDVAVLDYSDNIYDIWKDDGEIFQNGFAFGEMWQGKLDKVQKVSAWMPLPEAFKG